MIDDISGWAAAVALLVVAAPVSGCEDTAPFPDGQGGAAGAPSDGGSASGAVNLVGRVATLVGTIDRAPKKGAAGATTTFNAEFAESAVLVLPAPGACAILPATGDNGLVTGGTVVIKGTASPITVPARGVGIYQLTDPKADWKPGAKLTVTASGGADIGAFDVSAVAPDVVELTQDDLDVDLQKSLSLSWKPLDNGNVFFLLSGPARGGTSSDLPVILECIFPGKDGSAVITPAELTVFRPGNGTLGTESLSITVADDGQWKVALALVDAAPGLDVRFH